MATAKQVVFRHTVEKQIHVTHPYLTIYVRYMIIRSKLWNIRSTLGDMGNPRVYPKSLISRSVGGTCCWSIPRQP